MFLRTVKAAGGKGVEHEYVRLVEAYREHGKNKQRVEGAGPPLLGAHGYSRDGKSRNRQVLVGVVMVDDWPIAHHVFRGNVRDANTVGQVLNDLAQRFGRRRVVFVGDRGMVAVDNLTLLRSREQGYVVGLTRRRRENVYRYIERATGAWTECPLGIAARELEKPPRTSVQEVAAGEPGVRIFIVKSEERAGYETAQRLKAMERVRTQLERLTRRVEQGKLKAADKIGAASARTLGRYHGSRSYDWELKDGRFRFFEHPVNLKREQASEGKYVIQTEEKDLTPVQAVSIYKDLSEVERAFCDLKDVPRVTQRLVLPAPRVKSTTRTVRSTCSASVAERSCPAAFSFFSIARCRRKARLATKMCASTRLSVWWQMGRISINNPGGSDPRRPERHRP